VRAIANLRLQPGGNFGLEGSLEAGSGLGEIEAHPLYSAGEPKNAPELGAIGVEPGSGNRPTLNQIGLEGEG